MPSAHLDLCLSIESRYKLTGRQIYRGYALDGWLNLGSTKLITLETIKEARLRILPYIRQTPLDPSPELSRKTQSDVYLKLENQQLSGSFKTQERLYKLLQLSEEQKQKGVIASTAGNHGIGLSFAAKKLNIPLQVYLPKWTDESKVRVLTENNVQLTYFDSVEAAREAAKAYATKAGSTFVSAYNDREMIAGGGTIGLEILEDLKDIDILIVPLGGGGLASGVALAAKSINPEVKLYTVQSANSPLMTRWLEKKTQVAIELQPTLAEGLAVNMEFDTITFPLLQNRVDKCILVTETEIKEAMIWALEYHQLYLEGAGASTIAAIRKETPSKSRIAGILTGQNISFKRFFDAVNYRAAARTGLDKN